nr:GFA family protein [uncultured Lichenicoccus sp.]
MKVGAQVAHDHVCGCTRCWKPDDARVSLIAVVSRDAVAVTENQHKLDVVNPAATIIRHKCKGCGVHLYGRIEDRSRAF